MIKLPLCSTFLLIFYFTFSGCTSKNDLTLSESDFITVYAKLTIIDELNISKDNRDHLVEELLREFNIQVADIQNSIKFYQNNPRQWLTILERVKDKISELRKIERGIPLS
jgi:hypothetical protein